MQLKCVDLTDLRELTDGDSEIEAELFEEFITASNSLVVQMEKNLGNDGSEQWAKAAHAIKGIAGNLGAAGLADLARKAQESAGDSQQEKAALLEQIKAQHKEVLVFLADPD